MTGVAAVTDAEIFTTGTPRTAFVIVPQSPQTDFKGVTHLSDVNIVKYAPILASDI